MKKPLIVSAMVVAAMIALAGCSTGTGGGSMPGMDHGAAATSTSSSVSGTDHNAADTMFAQTMIPHHAQAVEMSDIMLAKKDLDAKIRALAEEIKAAQDPEIAKMTSWLTGWNESTVMAGNHTMDGMMTSADLDKLNAAEGTEASKLFLIQMIAHHEGAVEMAQTEVSSGQNTDAVALAKGIVSSQEAEIKAMKDLLATL